MRPRRIIGILLVALACAIVLFAPTGIVSIPAGIKNIPDGAPVSLAFWALVVMIGGWVLKGLAVAGRVTLQVLAWSVKALWAFAIAVQHAGIAIGKALAKFGKASWTFLRATYREVLKPAWTKFWNFVDRVRKQLEKVFRPVLKFLERVNKEILKFYDKWIRPVLDIIGVGRKVLRVLSALGLEWAKALDRKLGELEEAIDRPFRLVLRELNKVVNAVNRIMDANGLFQRLTLLRSVERDIADIFATLHNARRKPLTDEEKNALAERHAAPTPEQLLSEFDLYLRTGAGPLLEASELAAFEADAFLLPR